MDQKQLKKSISKLKALKTTLPKGYHVQSKWAEDLNREVEALEKATGDGFTEFKILQTELEKSVAFVSPGSGVEYRTGLWCQRDVLLNKLEGLLSYLSSDISSVQESRPNNPHSVIINSHGGQFQVGNHNSQIINITLQELVEKIASSNDPKAKNSLKELLENNTVANVIGATASAFLSWAITKLTLGS